jgi:hypothetical protein
MPIVTGPRDPKEQHTYEQRKAITKNYNEWFMFLGRRDGFQCRACHRPQSNLQIDHILPVSLGGTTFPENLQLLCARCNQRKGNRVLHVQSRQSSSSAAVTVPQQPAPSAPPNDAESLAGFHMRSLTRRRVSLVECAFSFTWMCFGFVSFVLTCNYYKLGIFSHPADISSSAHLALWAFAVLGVVMAASGFRLAVRAAVRRVLIEEYEAA